MNKGIAAMNVTGTDNEQLAREHFEHCDHDGALVFSYSIGNGKYLVAARPRPCSGHRLSTVVEAHEVDDKLCAYVGDLIHLFGYDKLLMRDLEAFEGKVM